MLGDFHGIDGELDVHVPFDLAPPGLVHELLGGFGHDRVAVVVEPIDQRPDRRVLLILDHGGVVERPHEISARLEFVQEPLVIDVETERLGGGVEVGAIDEQRDFLGIGAHGCSRNQMPRRQSKRREPPRSARSGGGSSKWERYRPHFDGPCPDPDNGLVAIGFPSVANRGPRRRQALKFDLALSPQPHYVTAAFLNTEEWPWPGSPWKTVSTRSKTVSTWSCSPATGRGQSRRAPRSLSNATTTRTRS